MKNAKIFILTLLMTMLISLPIITLVFMVNNFHSLSSEGVFGLSMLILIFCAIAFACYAEFLKYDE